MTGRAAMGERTTSHSKYYEIAMMLQPALLGVPARPAHGPLANPDTVTAFLPGSSVQAGELGPYLWALVRKSSDDERTVLCVYNVSDKSVSFDPTRYLGAEQFDRPSLLFLGGAARSHGSLTAPIVELAAHSFVWLGRFSTVQLHHDSKGRPQ